jgi:hypothetical protein
MNQGLTQGLQPVSDWIWDQYHCHVQASSSWENDHSDSGCVRSLESSPFNKRSTCPWVDIQHITKITLRLSSLKKTSQLCVINEQMTIS